MKYICDGCERLVEPERAGLGPEGQVELACPRCHAVSLAGAAPARSADVIPLRPEAPPAEASGPEEEGAPLVVVPASERCPKCATPKAGRESCARCGLVFELYKPESDPGLESMRKEFTALLQRWGEAAAREGLDRAGPQRLATLARLCRHHLADYPDDARARAMLELIQQRSVALATTAVASSVQAGTEGGPDNKRYLVLGVLAVLGALGILAANVLQHAP
jgi:hypothetical protein